MRELIRLEAITQVYAEGRGGEHRALDDVSLTIHAGDRVGLVGESGSGKTTLARVALNLLTPTGGARYFEGRRYAALDAADRDRFRKGCRMVFQNVGAMLNPLLPIRTLVHEPMRTHEKLDRAAREARIAEVFDLVDADPAWLRRYPHELSGGEQRRVALARALVVPPRLLVADEPVAGLDVVRQAELLEVLERAVAATGGALLLVSHDLAVAERLCHRMLVMRAGRVVEELDVTPEARIQDPYTRALFDASRLGDPAGPPSGVRSGE
jgi:ABC-type glutathione transport system ATPase component